MNEPETKAERLLRLVDPIAGALSDLMDELEESGSVGLATIRQCRALVAKYEYAKAAV